jgi:DNA-binding NarL/FixJ family response regulator
VTGEVIRLGVIDDHQLMREGIVEILDSYDDLKVVGVAGDSEGALAVLADQKPDVALLDVEIPGDKVTTTVTRIREISPRTRVLILSMYDPPDLVRNLLDLGISGYLLKNATRHQLVAAIRGANTGDGRIILFVSRRSLAQIQPVRSTTSTASTALSARERDVLQLVARAMSNAQIGSQLCISESTVKRHLSNAFGKLGAVSRIDAVNKAISATEILPGWKLKIIANEPRASRPRSRIELLAQVRP